MIEATEMIDEVIIIYFVGFAATVELTLLIPYIRFLPVLPVMDELIEGGETISTFAWKRTFAFFLLLIPSILAFLLFGKRLGFTGADVPLEYTIAGILIGGIAIFISRSSRKQYDQLILGKQQRSMNMKKRGPRLLDTLLDLRTEHNRILLASGATAAEIEELEMEITELREMVRKAKQDTKSLENELGMKKNSMRSTRGELTKTKKKREKHEKEIKDIEHELKDLNQTLKTARAVEIKIAKNLQEMVEQRSSVQDGLKAVRTTRTNKENVTLKTSETVNRLTNLVEQRKSIGKKSSVKSNRKKTPATTISTKKSTSGKQSKSTSIKKQASKKKSSKK